LKPSAGASAIDLGQRCHHAAGGLAGKPVVNGLGVPPGGHDAGAAKFGEMLGESRLAESDGFNQRADRSLTLDQLAQDRKPVHVGECGKKARRLRRLRRQLLRVVDPQGQLPRSIAKIFISKIYISMY